MFLQGFQKYQLIDKLIRFKLVDTIGILIISAALLFAATSAMSMDTRTMLTMFWGGDSWPAGTVYLTDSDGAYITDSDGAYITF